MTVLAGAGVVWTGAAFEAGAVTVCVAAGAVLTMSV
jgi:hypothetical protein